jgi:serine/threonine protein kinase
MARIIAVGEPVNDCERRVIAHLRDHAPDHWIVLHNVELPDQRHWYEIDLIVLAPHAVHVIDVKGTRGHIMVARNRWYPGRRAPFRSPVPKLRGHARTLKTLLTSGRPGLGGLYVGALVVLGELGAELNDPDGRDVADVCGIESLVRTLADPLRVPERFDACGELGRDHDLLSRLVGAARPPSAARSFGSWQVEERLSEGDDVTEYRARNRSLPAAPSVLLRVYPLDPYLPERERELQRQRVGNSFAMLGRLPGHPHIVSCRDFFIEEDESRCVLVLDDVHGGSLRLRMSEIEPLSRDAALRILRGVTSGLAHAHRHRVVHRALGPDTVLVAADGRPMLTGFDHARGPESRAATVAQAIPSVIDPGYLAPEGHTDPARLTAASDIYALGVLGYRFLTGELPFTDSTDQQRRRSVLSADELAKAEIPTELADWLGALCSLDPADRPSATEALRGFDRAMRRTAHREPPVVTSESDRERYRDLPKGYELTPTLVIRRRLGSGSFGVVYQVHNVLARTDQALKLVLTDPDSVVDRLQQEYTPLLALPVHPNVIRVHHADLLPGSRIPYLIFEYAPGQDVAHLAHDGLLSPADVRRLGIDAARGLAHIHSHGVYHCDIKPGNLLWTDNGTKIIDFNVAVGMDHVLADAGSSRYLPPDYQRDTPDLADRDTYALGLSLYEALTRGNWPWENRHKVPPGVSPRDPMTFTDLAGLAPDFVAVLLKAIQPSRGDRYVGAAEFVAALERVCHVRPLPRVPASSGSAVLAAGGAFDNPFVAHLQTLYSQSSTSNCGTRGLDPREFEIYVPTRLDDQLIPDVLDGRHALVIITGNAGDGKTAFLERLVRVAVGQNAITGAPRSNGTDFTLGGRHFHTNLDGSQDEGDLANDEVLAEFFAPYAGSEPGAWPERETRLIAINEGRLVDFLRVHAAEFPALSGAVRSGLTGTGGSEHGVTLVNLNARNVVAPAGNGTGAEQDAEDSIFDRMLRRMTDEQFWAECSGCALAERCYALHNARTFAHPDAGPRITMRLRTLFTLAHLRGKLHITLRDLRSTLAYLLTSGRNCAEIRDLYAGGHAAEILSGFYFQSWAGPPEPQDRLLRLLRRGDINDQADPVLDRKLGFVGPGAGAALMALDGRGSYDQELLKTLFRKLPRGGDLPAGGLQAHQEYVAAARRRFYFESQDGERWRGLLPHRSAADFLRILAGAAPVRDTTQAIVYAINRSEGLAEPAKLGPALVLAVRQVRGGSIRSYRLFPLDGFMVEAAGPQPSPYVENAPDRLLLRFDPATYATPPGTQVPELVIRLDLYEMLWRLRRGGLPAPVDLQGQHLSLTIFKNMLGAAPYQAVLLTVTGHDLHRIERSERDGMLTLGAQPAIDFAGENRWSG